MELQSYGLLGIAGLVAGFVDAIAGGGGMITVPALIHVGLPTHVALGTNKLQSSVGTTVAVVQYGRAGLVEWAEIFWVCFCTAISAAIGAWSVGRVPDDALRRMVPVLLILVAVYMVVGPKLTGWRRRRATSTGVLSASNDVTIETGSGQSARGIAFERAPQERACTRGFCVIAGGVLGFYDGFFGPGTGAFWTVAWVAWQGFELMPATAATKVLNLVSNLVSLMVFLFAGQVRWDCAGAMIVGQVVGARLGSGLAVRKGAVLIRPVFIAVVVAIAISLLLK